MRTLFTALALLAAVPAPAQNLSTDVAAVLASAGPGPRFGLLVTDEVGHELVAIRPDERFIPASNTKMVTTAAAFALLGDPTAPDNAGASVRLEAHDARVRDVVLVGGGDARLSSAADCREDCLSTLADAVAAHTRSVRDVIGDDSLFPDERWSSGMSWNNIPTRSGTGISALTLDNNEWPLRVAPGRLGGPPAVAALPYLRIDNRAVTVAGGATELSYDRLPNSDSVRLSGHIALGASPVTLRLGIDDPAHYAAWRLRALLVERGVRVAGTVSTRHRPLTSADDPATRGAAPPARPAQPAALARLTPPPLLPDLRETSKVSQNLHAELLLRRVGLVAGSGSVAEGRAAVAAILARAGVPRRAFDFFDGSGMSTYNRITPRAGVALLRWVAAQPWGAAWRDTLPVGGVDGTLARRFEGTLLEGRIFAKTGSLNATAAIAGYLVAASGRTLTFAAYANDVPGDLNATVVLDRALLLVAARN